MNAALIICAGLCGASAFFAFKVKRKNYGYVLAALITMIECFLCVGLVSCENPNKAREYLIAFYICHALSFFALALMIAMLSRRNILWSCVIPAGILVLLQLLIIGGAAGKKNGFAVDKSLKLGREWWFSKKTASGFFSFRSYLYLVLALVVICVAMLIFSYYHSSAQYRSKYVLLIIVLVGLAVLDIMTDKKEWPIWILVMSTSIGISIGFYFVNIFSGTRLKSLALTEFANDLSDGMVLFDEFDDMIYMNDCLKYSLAWESLSNLKTKAGIEEQILQTVDVYGKEVICCRNKEETENIYFTVKKKEFGEHSGSLGCIYVFHDTTDSVLKLQSMEEANIQLERASKMKADFLANMSHEIRTPMNAVIGMAEIALREDTSPEVASYLRQIVSSGHNLVNIINDILDYSKIEAGKMDIHTDDYEPLSELNDVANVLATRIGDKPLELFVHVPSDMPRLLHGDAMRIRQILINLANNAVKFTQEGIVFIDVSFERTAADEINLTYHVKDTGPGIKTEDLHKLFQNFQQVDSKRNRAVEGTGLGLAISQRLTEAMGGRIGVTSKYGVGSDFYFSIPQKVVDETASLLVDNADKKRALVLFDRGDAVEQFENEIKALGLKVGILHKLSEYTPGEEEDYLFFDKKNYNDEIRKFLEEHPAITGVVLVNFDSDFRADIKNLRVMRRPQTTINMVTALNNREVIETRTDGGFVIDYAAPEARILIVDDNAINITIAQGLLRPVKAICEGALSGAEALEKMKSGTYDLVLMDHMMPEMDGVETAKKIRAEIPGGDSVPIIALTANVLEGVKDMFLKEGMNDFVAKPVDIEDLLTKLKKWLPKDKVQALSPNEIETAETEKKPAVSFDGLDNEKAIQGLGSPELFAEIVEEYYRSGAGRLQDIRKAYEAEDWKDYTIKVHALKSASRQIGAEELGSMAEALEKAGNASDLTFIHENNENALQAYDALLNRLEPYFPEEEKQTGVLGEIAPEELTRLLDAIAEACENLDMDEAEAKCEELSAYSFSPEVTEQVQALGEAIGDYDVDRCNELIEKIRQAS